MTRLTHIARKVVAHRGLTIGLVLLAAICAMAIFAPLIAPFDPYDQDLSRRLIPPFWSAKANAAHWLGTDNLGRDYLSRLIYGARISLLIGFAVMVISGLIGTVLGLLAGYALWRGAIPPQIEIAGDAILKHLSLLFVPAGVGLIAFGDRLINEGSRLLVVLIASTAVTMAVTALAFRFLSRRMKEDA